MLVLSRKAAQQIVLTTGNETISIEVLKIAGNRVKVSIDASLNIAIRRSELPSDAVPAIPLGLP